MNPIDMLTNNWLKSIYEKAGNGTTDSIVMMQRLINPTGNSQLSVDVTTQYVIPTAIAILVAAVLAVCIVSIFGIRTDLSAGDTFKRSILSAALVYSSDKILREFFRLAGVVPQDIANIMPAGKSSDMSAVMIVGGVPILSFIVGVLLFVIFIQTAVRGVEVIALQIISPLASVSLVHNGNALNALARTCGSLVVAQALQIICVRMTFNFAVGPSLEEAIKCIGFFVFTINVNSFVAKIFGGSGGGGRGGSIAIQMISQLARRR